MGFETMASLKLLLQSIANKTPHVVERQDSFTMISSTKRRDFVSDPDITHKIPSPQKSLRPRKPSSLPIPLSVPPFQVAKSKWSPPASPGIIPDKSLSEGPKTTTDEKNSLANQLFVAACAGDLTAIECLLGKGAPINSSALVPGLFEAFQPAKSGQLSPLAGACLKGHLTAVRLLLAHGAELNPSSSRSSSSPLHQACRSDNLDIVQYLLQTGAQVDILDGYKVTPIMYASKYSSAALVSLLLEHKPDLSAVSFINAAAIHWSVWPGKVEVTELLLMARADPNLGMADGNTALHCAVLTGSIEMCKVLLRYGADPLRRNKSEETPLKLAEIRCETDEIPRLLRAAITARP